MMSQARRGACQFLVFACLVVTLCGCAGVARQVDAIPANPVAIDAFELNGRVNVRVKKENKAYPGRIRWQHFVEKEDLWIYTPLGNLVARLEQNADSALITNAQGDFRRGTTLAVLSRNALGYDLPIDALQYWIRGLEWPLGHTDAAVKDAEGRLATLSQGEWDIAYLSWTSKDANALPTKLMAENHDTKLTLIIDQWKFRNLERE